ncbi:hypothetical protein ILUMI_25016 [Ignelater luminosus]|uniref:Uncharacterized protein n=1 Tax=Ignelater luminosus TaxID=2038154 RepID=A0A8K0FY83_IGNLU|nr:hypothetical protein ILUMI_25016 [Ignelater luminosus]
MQQVKRFHETPFASLDKIKQDTIILKCCRDEIPKRPNKEKKRNRLKKQKKNPGKISEIKLKILYKTLKNQRKGRKEKLEGIEDKEGNLLINNKQIAQRWREYFCKIVVVMRYRDEMKRGIAEEIKSEELKNGKAAGHNEIKAEMIKRILNEVYKRCLEMEKKEYAK